MMHAPIARHGEGRATKYWCQQTGSLATALGLVIKACVPFKLPKQLGDMPLLAACNEFFECEGDGRFLGRLAADCDNAIDELPI